MKARIEMTAAEIRTAIAEYVRAKTGVEPNPDYIFVQVKSKNNRRDEWEQADFRAHFDAPQEIAGDRY